MAWNGHLIKKQKYTTIDKEVMHAETMALRGGSAGNIFMIESLDFKNLYHRYYALKQTVMREDLGW